MESGIESLIAGGETYTVEFKSDVNDDELTEAVVCLANGDGGRLLLGVADDGTVAGANSGASQGAGVTLLSPNSPISIFCPHSVSGPSAAI